MKNLHNLLTSTKLIKIIICLLAWSILWFAPWQPWLDKLRWVQVTLGTLLFIVPGSVIYILLSQEKNNGFSAIPVGFVISITIASILGIVARIFHLSFDFIMSGFFFTGVILLSIFNISNNQGEESLKRNKWTILVSLGLLIPVLIAVYIASDLSIPPIIHDDDLSYNALLAYYRYADSLDFNDTVTHISRVRFWLAFWPLVEAIIAHLSGMHGLLLTGIYISPVLVILSLCGIYHLGSVIGLKFQFGLVAVAAQIGSLIRLTEPSHPGVAFFNVLTQDKNVAAFTLSFVVVAESIKYLKTPRRSTFIITTLAILGLGFTHPTVLGMTALILVIYAFINSFFTKKWWPSVILLLAIIIIMIPHFSLRFFEEEGRRVYTVESDVETMRDYKINPHRIRILGDTKFFGISPDVIDGLPFTLLIFASVFSLTRLKQDIAARYFVTILIVLGIIYFPYTGWLLGLAITPFHLWRIPRLFPFGLSMAYLFQWGIYFLMSRLKKLEKYKEFANSFMSSLACIVIIGGIIYILPWAKGNLGGSKPGFDQWYEYYIEIGEYLGALERTDYVIVGGLDSITNDIIPSIAFDANLVSFRNENPGPNTELWNSMIKEDTSPEERLNLLNQYDVNYVLLREEVNWIEEIQQSFPGKFELKVDNKKLRLYEYTP